MVHDIDLHELLRQIESLVSVRNRHILWLRYRWGWKQAAIAELFDKSQSTIHEAIETSLNALHPLRESIMEFSSQTNDHNLLALREAIENR